MSHVAYDHRGRLFDGDCPASHPVKLLEIHLYFRIAGYEGGDYVFADGTGRFHADYMSGWDEVELQAVLDGCSNDSDAAMPNAFCEDFLTFRDGPRRRAMAAEEDGAIRQSLEHPTSRPARSADRRR